jgi:gamma-glutamyltranspeptidase/glutathione hydrolase
MSFGVMGGDMQPQAHLQVTVRMLDYGQNPQAAADAPRWKVSKTGEVLLEPGVPTAIVEGLRDRGHRVLVSKKGEVEIGSYGSAQLIYRVEGGYIAGSEGRRDGQAVGY